MMNQPWVHIIGAGVSGLSLAYRLAQTKQLPGDVIISDPHLDSPQSQTFCFWFDQNTEQDLNPERRWSEWSFSSHEQRVSHTGSRYTYGMVSGSSFRHRSVPTLISHPQIHLNSDFISQKPNAEHVFDSRPPKINDYRVKQSFVGLEVELTQPHGLCSVQLMHDLICIDQGVQFRYVLPLSDTRLLVEYTRFTTQDTSLDVLDNANRVWIKQSFGQSFTLIRTERAHIPMGLNGGLSHFGAPIGARAGMTRDATGYGFVQMLDWAKSASDQLLTHNQVEAYRPSTLRSWMDNHLLKMIEQRPDVLPRVFMHLSSTMSADHFARFMMRCTFTDALRAVLCAPKRPFIFSALNKLQWI